MKRASCCGPGPRKNSAPLFLFASVGVIAVAGAVIAFQHWDSPRFESWTREDGPIENFQALLDAAGAALFFAFASRNRRCLWAWCFAFGLLLLAGEEISWGQRIFNFTTPSGLNDVNIQHEVNLHNIENVHGNTRTYGFMLFGVIFVVLPVVEAFHSRLHIMRTKIGLFHIPLQIAPIATAAFGFMLIPRYIDANAFGFDEVGELFASITLCLLGATLALDKLAVRRPLPLPLDLFADMSSNVHKRGRQTSRTAET